MGVRVDFEEYRQKRIAKQRAQAEQKQVEGAGELERAQQLADRIPLGQPILQGHHSEAKHRRDLDKIHTAMSKGVDALEQADKLARRAERAERVPSIRSDDPEAPQKLRDEIAKAEGDSAKVSRLRKRLAEVETEQARPDNTTWYGEIQVTEAEGRVRLVFPGKPSSEVRAELKRSGFKFAPSVGAWQRVSSNRARYLADWLAERFGGPKQAAETLCAEDAAFRLPEQYRGRTLEQLRTAHQQAGWQWSPLTGEWAKLR